jgi:pimeloyl-ACP methyl ester carboxylesterase
MRLHVRSSRPSTTHARLVTTGVAVAAIALSPLVPAAVAAPSVAPAAARAAAHVPRVSWISCYQWLADYTGAEAPLRYECAQVPVPLDHDAPNGATVLIRMVRIPASDTEHRIGTLFLNPGGPGGSGVDFALNVGSFLYSPEVRARFDLVGFDPRGIGRSTQLRCAGNWRQTGSWFTSVPWPETTDEIEAWGSAGDSIRSDCDQKGGRILDHMTTADVARDLDVLRRAVGDAQLTYAGYSYGSYLGTTYANLFPEKVRAVVVDGVLDPVAWSTGEPGQQGEPFSARLRSDIGARDTLAEFFRLCDEAGDGCPFSAAGGSAERYSALEARLDTEPIDVGDFLYDDRVLVLDSLGAMYSSPSWWFFADFLAFLDSTAGIGSKTAAATLESKRRSLGVGPGGFPRYPGFEGFNGVACADSDNPSSIEAWATTAAERAAVSRFGPMWTWVSSGCAGWPGSGADRYTGPWTAATANPVLVVNTRFDPATPLHGANRVASLLPDAHQLTVEGWGHTTLFLSAAADAAVSDYLLDGTLPGPGDVFTQDVDPMAPPPEEPLASGVELRARYLQALLGKQPRR